MILGSKVLTMKNEGKSECPENMAVNKLMVEKHSNGFLFTIECQNKTGCPSVSYSIKINNRQLYKRKLNFKKNQSCKECFKKHSSCASHCLMSYTLILPRTVNTQIPNVHLTLSDMVVICEAFVSQEKIKKKLHGLI